MFLCVSVVVYAFICAIVGVVSFLSDILLQLGWYEQVLPCMCIYWLTIQSPPSPPLHVFHIDSNHETPVNMLLPPSCSSSSVANTQLRGDSDLDVALVLQYVNFADAEVLPAVCTWTFPTLGIMQPNQQVLCPCMHL